jgi:glycosyltransferase involved in cell wall biosynthesis
LEKLKINIVSYLDPYHYNGGGEYISRQVIDFLRSEGHSIKISSVRPNQFDFNWNSDLDILIDIFNYPGLRGGGAWRKFENNFLKKIINKGKFVHMTNAYTDICDLPYLPCNGEVNSCCKFKSSLFTDLLLSRKIISKCSLNNSIRIELFSKSLINIFLSPLHKDTINKSIYKFGLDLNYLNDKSFILKPVVDSTIFYNKNHYRDIDYLFVGVISEAKGFYNLKKLYKNENVHFVGDNQVGKDLDFGTYHGKVNKKDLSDIYNRTKSFLYLPRWPEPQGMVVIEAAMCGCKIISNENVGALSFNFDLSNPQNFINSLPDLMSEIFKKI